MNENSTNNSVNRSIKRLTIAVWILVVVSILNLGITIVVPRCTSPIAQQTTVSVPNYSATELASSFQKFKGFHDWPIDEQVSKASVIALTKWKKEEGKLKSVITEVLKIAPSTIVYYNVGDEYGHGRHPIENADYGDGEILFFTGSPAEFIFSTTHRNGRITGMADMPIEMLKNKIREETK